MTSLSDFEKEKDLREEIEERYNTASDLSKKIVDKRSGKTEKIIRKASKEEAHSKLDSVVKEKRSFFRKILLPFYLPRGNPVLLEEKLKNYQKALAELKNIKEKEEKLSEHFKKGLSLIDPNFKTKELKKLEKKEGKLDTTIQKIATLLGKKQDKESWKNAIIADREIRTALVKVNRELAPELDRIITTYSFSRNKEVFKVLKQKGINWRLRRKIKKLLKKIAHKSSLPYNYRAWEIIQLENLNQAPLAKRLAHLKDSIKPGQKIGIKIGRRHILCSFVQKNGDEFFFVKDTSANHALKLDFGHTPPHCHLTDGATEGTDWFKLDDTAATFEFIT